MKNEISLYQPLHALELGFGVPHNWWSVYSLITNWRNVGPVRGPP
jgi:hypothetical protein